MNIDYKCWCITCYPDHDQYFCPGELCGLDSEDLERVVSDGDVGKGGDAFKPIGRIEHQQTQEDDKGGRMSNKLHKRTA